MLRIRWCRGAALVLAAGILALTRGSSAPPLAIATTRVELTRLGDGRSAAALLAAIGATVEVESGDRIQARVPASAVSMLHAANRLVRVEQPGVFVPLEVLSGGTLIGAEGWSRGGLTGRGQKIAVLDTDFLGYRDALGGALPSSVTIRSFRSDGAFEGTSDHGRRAAEIVHGIAPGAELYLVSFSTITELSAAVDYLVAQHIDIVSYSSGYIHNGPGDGTGSVDTIVGRATGTGMLWAVAAGNWAQQHWSGVFRDDNRDAIHEFRPGLQQLSHPFVAGDQITLSLRWDDVWGAACADYDIELYSPNGALVRASRDLQNCSGNPVEVIRATAAGTGNYSARVVGGNASAPRRLDVIFVGSPDRDVGVDVPVPGGSLGAPADAPGVVTVGALANTSAPSEAPYSSRGPTSDGRAKPEILAPVAISAGGIGAFSGTSSAAPRVAAAIALLREALPGVDRARIIAELQARGVVVPSVPDGTEGVRRLDLASLDGIGPLLPRGAEDASLAGTILPGVRVAEVAYHGAAGYPLRFLYRLTGGRDIAGAWMLDRSSGRWRGYVAGAPASIDEFDRVSEGDSFFIVLR